MQIEEGAVVSGKVTGLTDFGAFVELEGGKTGMIHISEVASSFVKEIRDYLTENQEVKVKVIREHLSVGQEVTSKVISITPQGKISLSIKKLNDQPKEQQRERRPQQRQRSEKRSAPQVWNGQKSSAPTGEKQSFEARFKQVSDEKMTDLKRTDSKRGSVGYSRRGQK